MKTRFLMLFLFAILSGACSSDDSQPAEDRLTFGGENYALTLAQYDTFQASLTNFSLLNYPGGTHSLNLQFGAITEIPDGKYEFREIDDADYDPDKHFAGGALYIAPNNEPIPITGGWVRFSKKGDEYKITFDVETAAGRVKGNYVGPLIQI